MRTILGLFVVVLAAGCGYYPFPYTADGYTVQADCLTFTSDLRPDVKALAANVALSRDILDRRGILKASDYCSTFASIPIAIRGRWRLGSDEATGQYSRWSGIELAEDTGALLHEEIHVLECDRWDCFRNHPNWTARGYWAADAQFTLAAAWPFSAPATPQ